MQPVSAMLSIYRAQAVAAERSARESYESELRQQVVCRCAASAATLAPAMPAEALVEAAPFGKLR
jgi:hypothetical protein